MSSLQHIRNFNWVPYRDVQGKPQAQHSRDITEKDLINHFKTINEDTSTTRKLTEAWKQYWRQGLRSSEAEAEDQTMRYWWETVKEEDYRIRKNRWRWRKDVLLVILRPTWQGCKTVTKSAQQLCCEKASAITPVALIFGIQREYFYIIE